jgi:hypothetical protein
MVAAAALAAATLWTPVALTYIAGPLAFVACVVVGIVAVVFYRPSVPVLAGEAVNVGALAVTVIMLLAAGCGDPAGHIDGWVWAVSIAAAVGGGTWALLRPRHAWWGVPLATLVGAALATGLATVLTGNTGLCPD